MSLTSNTVECTMYSVGQWTAELIFLFFIVMEPNKLTKQPESIIYTYVQICIGEQIQH